MGDMMQGTGRATVRPERRPELDQECAAVLEALGGEGLHGALRRLNARTRYRFTGIYRFDPPLLRNVALFDRENPALRLSDDAVMRETYCSLVGERAAPLAVTDGEHDPRAAQTGAWRTLRAYCGVPLRDASGAVVGTLCHFDPRPRLPGPADQALLERVASELAGYVTPRRA